MITVMELQLIFFLLSFIHGIYGQVTEPPSTAVARGEDVSLVCTSTETNPTFTWTYVTAGQSLYIGTTRGTTAERYANIVLQEGGTDVQTSILDISAIVIQDQGEYLCSTVATTNPPPGTEVTVEVEPVSVRMELIVISDDSNSTYKYQATCETIGSLPEENITWILGGVAQSDGIMETDPDISTDPLLFDKRSVFTFPSTPENYNVQLVCDISGHQVARFNRQLTERVDIHKPPQPGVIMIDLTINETELTISCDDTNSAAVPAMSTFNIYSNGALITKPVSDKTVTVTEPEQRTEFTCEGSNYLGSTTTTKTYGSTTTLTPTTTAEPITPEGNMTTLPGVSTTQTPTPDTGVTSITTTTEQPRGDGANVAAIAGGVVGAIVVIVIIVIAVCYCKKEERYCFEAGGPKSSGSSKPAGSAVGSSNGSERDVESPLNGVKDVTAEEKTKPEAAPRGHGSIQHTNDNPNQDMYAMVDKKPSGGRGGDAPDRGSGPGQNEPQGMLYADLDLSHKAGHTDKHVPKNENDVVVYSSILV